MVLRRNEPLLGAKESLPEIPFVVLHSGLLQQRDQLLLKCSLSMMFNWIADVSRKLSRIGFAHTERRVSRLPREATMQDTILMNPARGICLEDLDGLCHSQGRR